MKPLLSPLVSSVRRTGMAWLLLQAMVGAPPSQVTWEFDTPTALGVAPAGWVNASQNVGSPAPFQATTFLGQGVVQFTTAAGTTERPKIRTTGSYTTGTYQWRVYTPDFEANAQCSLGAFLYSAQSGGTDNDREIDFEIGYGSAAARSTYGIPAGRLICYMTVQRDDSSGTPLSSLVFQPSNSSDHIEPNAWYTLTLGLTTDGSGRYVVSWDIQKDGGPLLQGRPDFVCQYGPSNGFPTDFRIYNSLENLLFMGDNLPTVSHQANFDRVTFTPPGGGGSPEVIEDFEAFPLADPYTITTSANSESVSRFGVAYSGAGVTALPANVADGSQALRIDCNWGAGSFVGLRRWLSGSERDWTGATTFSVYARELAAGGATIAIGLEEEDGEVWRSGNAPLTTALTKFGWTLTAGELSNVDSGSVGTTPGAIDLTDVAIFDVILRDTAGTAGVAIDRLEVNSGVPAELTGFMVE